MRIVPVLDLLNGKVVRGVAGDREKYAPIVSRICDVPSPGAVASAFASLGFKGCYVADLGAIAGSPPDVVSYRAIAAAGLAGLWVDAGVGSAPEAMALDEALAPCCVNARVIVGSETFLEPAELPELVDRLGPEQVVFSLDLKAGRPLVAADEWLDAEPLQIVTRVLQCGVRSLIVLDLANVGVSSGVGTESLCRAIRDIDDQVEVIAGGGVRNVADLHRLANWGCKSALVASAVHDGKISQGELREFI